MPREIVGKLSAAPSDRFGIVVSRYHSEVTQRLLDAAVETLTRHGTNPAHITILWVPGSYELGVVADQAAKSGRFDAIITLGAVVQGDTDHHDYINHSISAGFVNTSQATGVPVIFGVLTTKNMEQAFARAGGAVGNKGAEAASVAIETVSVIRQIHQLTVT